MDGQDVQDIKAKSKPLSSSCPSCPSMFHKESKEPWRLKILNKIQDFGHKNTLRGGMRLRMNKRFRLFAFILIVVGLGQAMLAGPAGYFRQPSIHKNIVAFVAEGDLWTVSADGGDAVHLTNHPGTESTPAISPDGKTIAFIAHYEGPREVYTMPLTGGLPTRRTYDGESVAVVGWTRDNQILCST